MRRAIFIITLFLTLLLGCQDHPLQQLGLTSVSQKVDEYTLAGGEEVVVDILFIVDNSGSMLEEQRKVANNIEKFMQKLKEKSEKTKYQIGVVTISIANNAIDQKLSGDRLAQIATYEDGRLQKIVTKNPGEPGTPTFDSSVCSNSDNIMDRRFLTNTDNANISEYLSNTIKCVGSSGAVIERGLDVLYQTFSEERLNGDNIGFLRPEAKLMVIMITDEDDCSTGITEASENKHITKTEDCVEQSDLFDSNSQKKLRAVEEYVNFLIELKGGDSTKIGFASIVGPQSCWTGAINDMGTGPSDSSIPYPFGNCNYTSNFDSTVESNYLADVYSCTNEVPQICSCDSTASNQCQSADLFTTCYNNDAGVPNRTPFVDQNNPCSELYLHGYCSEGQHCDITDKGVKCVDDTCSPTNLIGSCPAGKVCSGGSCVDQTPAVYSEKSSVATPGKRYLRFGEYLESLGSKDVYSYPICLQDFGTPLSLIGAKLADAKCEYDLQSKTDDPCNLIIKIAPPTGQTLPNGLNEETSLGNPWTYTLKAEYSATITPEDLLNICRENRTKPFAEQTNISQYLDKVACGKNHDGEVECLKILFPEETGVCPQAGSSVEIYYGVVQ
ncbi:hypothetical protein JXR93_06660 [bacterium]|nr:hypothetical protein [bacterium]